MQNNRTVVKRLFPAYKYHMRYFKASITFIEKLIIVKAVTLYTRATFYRSVFNVLIKCFDSNITILIRAKSMYNSQSSARSTSLNTEILYNNKS